MASIKKIVTGGMNSDASNDLMPPNDFRDAINLNIDVDGVVSVKGNRKFKSSYIADGYWCAGSYYDKVRRRIYAFLAHENQRNRFVVVHVDVEAVVTIWENITDSNNEDILGWDMPATFDAGKVIKSIRVIHRDFGGDLVYFIDPNGVPLKYNFENLAGGGYGDSPTFDMFKVIAAPPAQPPTAVYADDSTRNINNLRKKLFMFSTRFVYADDEKSVWSAKSKIPLPLKSEDGAYYADGTKSNVIKITVPTGSKLVKKIEVAARVNVNSNWSDYFLIDTLDKEELEIANDSQYQYSFYNDGAYQAVDVQESNLLFDYVPDKANCMELANGNVLVFGGITEGLDKEVDLDVDASVELSASVITTVSYVVNNISTWEKTVAFTGEVNENDYFKITVSYRERLGPREVPSYEEYVSTYEYTVLSGDDIDDVVSEFASQINPAPILSASNLGGGVLRVRIPEGSTYYALNITVELVGAGAVSGTDSIPMLKWGGRYKYSLHYESADGKTRGIYNSKNPLTIDAPFYDEADTEVQTPKVTLSINHQPPSWASRFHWVRTKELTSLKSLFILTQMVDEDSDYAYISIENLNTHIEKFPSFSNSISYEFTDGDRIRFIKNVTTEAILESLDYDIIGVVKHTIDAVEQDCIKVKKVTGMPSFSIEATVFYVELFTPAPVINSDEENVYYEIGERYSIATDSNGNRYHLGQSQNQVVGEGAQPAVFVFTEGDYYFRQRSLTVDSDGTTEDYYCADQNFSDYYKSGVWSQGRPLVIDDSIREQYYPGLIRHSLQYIQGTNINLLNRFYPENFEDADPSFGDVLNMKSRENFIRVFQRFKVGSMPVFRQIFIDNAGSSNVALSEKVLNKINYYAGDYGIDKYGLSLVSTDFGDYFIDDINRAFVRASLDGITNIGDALSMVKFFNTEVENGYTGIGAFDYERREVIIKILNTDNEGTKVVRFSESRKGFQPRLSFTDAEAMLFVDGFLWTFKGVPYVHDNEDRCVFYDEETAPFMTLVFNGGQDLKKTFTNVSMVSNRKWGCTSIKTSTGQSSELKIEDFVMREDGYHAALLRDSSSPGGLLRGDTLKGNWIELKLEGGAASSLSSSPSVTSEYELTLCAVYFNESNLNKR